MPSSPDPTPHPTPDYVPLGARVDPKSSGVAFSEASVPVGTPFHTPASPSTPPACSHPFPSPRPKICFPIVSQDATHFLRKATHWDAHAVFDLALVPKTSWPVVEQVLAKAWPLKGPAWATQLREQVAEHKQQALRQAQQQSHQQPPAPANSAALGAGETETAGAGASEAFSPEAVPTPEAPAADGAGGETAVGTEGAAASGAGLGEAAGAGGTIGAKPIAASAPLKPTPKPRAKGKGKAAPKRGRGKRRKRGKGRLTN